MYQLNEIEVWRQRREELLREAESERLARRLRPARAARIRNSLLGRARVLAAGDLHTGDNR